MIKKRKVGRYKLADDYNKVGRDFKEIVKNYKKNTTTTELKLFLSIPVIISILVFIYFWFFEHSNTNLLNYIMGMNKTSLTIIAILAGFNTTSLSIIAASNNKVLAFLKRKKTDNDLSILKQLVSFFSFAILIQLLVLIIGLLLSMLSNSFVGISNIFPVFKGLTVKILLSLFGVIWLSTVLFTIIISIRNATLLYSYVLFLADYDDKGE